MCIPAVHLGRGLHVLGGMCGEGSMHGKRGCVHGKGDMCGDEMGAYVDFNTTERKAQRLKNCILGSHTC